MNPKRDPETEAMDRLIADLKEMNIRARQQLERARELVQRLIALRGEAA